MLSCLMFFSDARGHRVVPSEPEMEKSGPLNKSDSFPGDLKYVQGIFLTD